MVNTKVKRVLFRRKADGKTNYKKRLNLLKAKKPRLVIRKTNKNIIAQIILYNENGDKIISQSNSKDLEKLGWKYSKGNIPSSYLIGLQLAKNTERKEAILDIGLQKSSKGARIYACLKGVIDGGINVPHSKDVFPSEDRILGKHIADYAKKVGMDKQFSGYKKASINIEEIEKSFNDIKNKILKVKK